MPNTNGTEHLTPASREMLISMLETLPDAMFVVDDVERIVYANASAQTIAEATPEQLLGSSFWRCTSQLVSTALYRAVHKAKQTREPTEVEYISPVTRNWLHVRLAPSVGGLMLQFHQVGEPARRQQTFSQGERLSIDDLDGLRTRIGVLTPEGIVLDINEVPLDDAQVRREEVIGKPLAQTPWWSFSPASQEQLRAAIARASTGETVHFETLLRPREGMVRHFESVITPHVDADHHSEYLVIAGIDITERKRAEADIHALVDAIPQLVWIARPDGFVTYHNQRLIDYLAMTQKQAEGTGWLAGVHPDDRQRVWQAWQTSIQTRRPYEVEVRLQDGSSGAYRWFLVRGMPRFNTQGTILDWVGTCTDIDDQKRTEQRLKESRESLRVLAETVPQMVWVVASNGLQQYVNQRGGDYTGLTLEQLQSDRWAFLQAVHPDDQEGHRAHWQYALDTGCMFEHEQRLKHSQTGEYRWFLTRALPMRDEAGQIVKWFGTCTDIDEQKRLEEALRQSQERASVLMNSSIIGISVVEEEQIVDANDTFLHMTGYTREDLRTGRMNVLQMTAPDYLARTLEAHQKLATQQVMTPYEKEYLCKDGSRLPVVVGGVVLQRHPLQGIAFVLDNSARKALEERKDDFISMASHELRNPLTALQLQTILLHRQLTRQGALDQIPALSRMETQIKTITRLVEELLDVSKIQAGKLEYRQERVDLDALLEEITETIRHTHSSHSIVVRGAVQASLIGDRDRLGQVFTNLLSNAIKYSPDAEAVEIDLSESEGTVTISIRDHGLGIPREQHEKIFERFYRAAGPKQKVISGLGMGLYVVAEIVKHHEGTITVESTVGKGSTFTVVLPIKRDA